MIVSNKKKINHLFWRAGFGLAPQEWEKYQNLSIPQAVQHLFKGVHKPNPFGNTKLIFKTKEEVKKLSEKEKKELKKMNRNTNADLSSAWVSRMGNPKENALLEKMNLFWHGHFACESKLSHYNVTQHNTIRKHALGNFRDLLLAIAKDPAMILYLNNQQNKKWQPNENFARELMELFTLGIGNYTEKDVKESARAFTGWTTNIKGEFIFKSQWHDFDTKTFMGKTGNFNGEDIIDIILERKETARFVCRKIYRYFVNTHIEEDKVDLLSHVFYDSNYDISETMKVLFTSDWFYDAKNIGTKIKSPAELLGGLIRTLGLTFEDRQSLIFGQKALGQVLLHPPNVAGWPGGKAWIDNNTLMLRLNLVAALFNGQELEIKLKEEAESKMFNQKTRKIKGQLNLQPILHYFEKIETTHLFDQLENYLLQTLHPLDKPRIEQFVIKNSKTQYITTLMIALMSLPEYQMC